MSSNEPFAEEQDWIKMLSRWKKFFMNDMLLVALLLSYVL
jgi:hypothetical protein